MYANAKSDKILYLSSVGINVDFIHKMIEESLLLIIYIAACDIYSRVAEIGKLQTKISKFTL